MRHLLEFFIEVIWAIRNNTEFVAQPYWWLTANNLAYAESHNIDVARSACPFFWRAVWFYPLSRVTEKEVAVTTISVVTLVAFTVSLGLTTFCLTQVTGPVPIGEILLAFLAITAVYTLIPLIIVYIAVKTKLFAAPFIAVAILLAFGWQNMVLGAILGLVIGAVVVAGFTFATRNYCPTVKYKN